LGAVLGWSIQRTILLKYAASQSSFTPMFSLALIVE
jgi:hypothetical protein